MDLQKVEILNPWWQCADAIREDPHLQAVRGQPFYFDNPVRQTLDLLPDHLTILRGSRQVGKTTLLKEKILEAIVDRRYPPEACLFLTCEALPDFSVLQQLLADWLRQHTTQPVLVCLDEITFVPEWQRALLWLINAGLTRHATVLITGSNARDLKQSAERFPGRHVQERRVYPLGVRDYATLDCFRHMTCAEQVTTYLHVGGFPHAVRDYYQHGHVTDETYETYANWIFGDAHRFALHREILVHILQRLCDTTASRITWQTLIADSPVHSHETAAHYIEHLEDAFLTVVLRCYDPNRKMAAPRKARKVYFIDPLLYALVGGYLQGVRNTFTWWRQQLTDAAMQGRIFESVVVNQMARGFPHDLYYWYSAPARREVDLLVRHPDRVAVYEVKMQDATVAPVLLQPVQVITPHNLERFLPALTVD